MNTPMEVAFEGEAALVGVGSPAQFVTFDAGGIAYGIDIMTVREIRSWSRTTPLPDARFGSCGVLDIRGKIVEVYDLAALLGGSRADQERSSVVLVVSLNGQTIGLQADSVSDIIFATADDFRPAPQGAGRKVSNLVKQGDRLIAILNLDVMLPASEGSWTN